jgi:PKD repeat protein
MKKELTRLLIAFVILLVFAEGVSAFTITETKEYTVNASEQVDVLINFSYDAGDGDPLLWTATFNWSDDSESDGFIQNDTDTGNVTGSHTYNIAGTYSVNLTVINETAEAPYVYELFNGTVAVVTVNPYDVSENVKITPRSLNLENRGIMTVFMEFTNQFREWLGFGDGERLTATEKKEIRTQLKDGEMFEFEGAQPERVKFNMKDGGTFMFKFRRNEVKEENLKDDKIQMKGSAVNGTGAKYSFEINKTVNVKNAGNDDPDEDAEVAGAKGNNGKGKKDK